MDVSTIYGGLLCACGVSDRTSKEAAVGTLVLGQDEANVHWLTGKFVFSSKL